ncbi:ankyrin repeat domain-containing protein [Novilysobacter arseniciresistens]|uniref:ankyrin repeat domain-containing protein n=1 Tax=Novilysobacter arseniciresistens TaxID=1385522 RepID=UPI0009DD6BFA|nr:ankyrin repeat domain-containing protein [Lysobacter arseniciresistens]
MSAHIVDMQEIDVLVSWSVKQGLLEGMGVSNPDELGQILHDENVRSVNYRYDEQTQPDTYTYTPMDHELDPEVVHQRLRSLNYQSCETEDWYSTKANECLAHIDCDLIDHVPREYRDLHGARHPMVVEKLIGLGKNPNGIQLPQDDTEQHKPLHFAKTPEIAQALIDAGADVEARNTYGLTPMHWLARNGRHDTLQVLIDNGADPMATDNFGNTPLHCTTAYGRYANAEVLVNAGADPMATNNAGKTPLDLAEENGVVQTKAAMEAAVLNARTIEASGAWSPSQADTDALVPQATGEQHNQVRQQGRRL